MHHTAPSSGQMLHLAVVVRGFKPQMFRGLMEQLPRGAQKSQLVCNFNYNRKLAIKMKTGPEGENPPGHWLKQYWSCCVTQCCMFNYVYIWIEWGSVSALSPFVKKLSEPVFHASANKGCLVSLPGLFLYSFFYMKRSDE